MSKREQGKLFIISGPSGVGKSTVLSEVFRQMEDIYFSVSVTTRAPRPGEVDGVNYHFITGEQFADLIAEDGLLESAQYVGNFYGTPVAPIREKTGAGTNVILDIEVQGVRQVKEKMPEAVAVFLAPPSMEELEQRLRGRGTDDEDKIQRRIETAREECAQVAMYDYIVFNDTVEHAVAEIVAIITAEQCKCESRQHLICY